MHTVVETPSYLKSAEKLFGDAEREEIVTAVSSDPECGDLIPGSGGFRKMRIGPGFFWKERRGKSGLHTPQ